MNGEKGNENEIEIILGKGGKMIEVEDLKKVREEEEKELLK